jgi:hypothetical protein
MFVFIGLLETIQRDHPELSCSGHRNRAASLTEPLTLK